MPALPLPQTGFGDRNTLWVHLRHFTGKQRALGHSSIHLNARHSCLLNKQGDKDEAPQALSPRQCDDGVQVPAQRGQGEGLGGGGGSGFPYTLWDALSPWNKTVPDSGALYLHPVQRGLADSERGAGLLWFRGTCHPPCVLPMAHGHWICAARAASSSAAVPLLLSQWHLCDKHCSCMHTSREFQPKQCWRAEPI